MSLKVNEQSAAVKAMAAQWGVCEALVGGTPAMRAAGKPYLPQWPAEEEAAYKARLATATLFPAYKRTIGVMAAKPFSKALSLSEDTPGQIKSWCEDVDRQGVSLHAFAAEMFPEALSFGIAGVLVDYPDTRQRDASGAVVEGPAERTVAQVEAEGLRPYFVRVRHDQILGWRTALVGGRLRLTQLRLLESREAEDGEWGTTFVPQVRVLTPGGWAVYEEQAGEGAARRWVRVDAGTTSLPYIPFVPFYGRREDFMIGAPPLLDLAYLNVKHWQSQSDQDTILHAARVPILAMIGAENDTPLVIGASTAVRLPMDADLKWVEHNGASIEAGANSLAALEEQMIQTGAELLVKKPGERSATEAAGDQEGNKCDLQRAAETFEDSLDAALQIMADYARQPSGGNVSLFKDYGAATLSDASATLVKDLQMAGLISKETAINEMKRRGVLAMEVDAAEEIAAAEAEGPAPGELGTDPAGNPLAPVVAPVA